MPQKVEEIKDALIKDPKFKPMPGRTKEESAWAVAQSKYNKMRKAKPNKKGWKTFDWTKIYGKPKIEHSIKEDEETSTMDVTASTKFKKGNLPTPKISKLLPLRRKGEPSEQKFRSRMERSYPRISSSPKSAPMPKGTKKYPSEQAFQTAGERPYRRALETLKSFDEFLIKAGLIHG